jgi:hypothetical protein
MHHTAFGVVVVAVSLTHCELRPMAAQHFVGKASFAARSQKYPQPDAVQQAGANLETCH